METPYSMRTMASGESLKKMKMIEDDMPQVQPYQLTAAARERLQSGITRYENPGEVYMFRFRNVVVDETDRCSYKIGFTTRDSEDRVRELERRNGEEYLLVHQVNTPYPYLTEQVLLQQLRLWKDPTRDKTKEGYTEWVFGTEDFIKGTMNWVKDQVEHECRRATLWKDLASLLNNFLMIEETINIRHD